MSLEIKRIKLYKVFRKVATENNLLSAFDGMYPDFSTWERTNFKDDNSVISIWNKALKAFLEPTSKEDFFGTFACDILKTSIYCGGGSTTTTGSTTGNTTNTTGNTTNTTGNVVNITKDEVANGSKLVKQGMSGDIVREIQKLLIKHGFTNISKSGKIDGIYGSRTAQAVYDFQQKSEIATDRVVGKETWGKLIQEPTTTKVTPPKLDPKTGLPDNSFGLPKFDTSVDRFNKFGISKEKQDADLKKLGLKENMRLTDIVNGMVQEQSVIPGVGINRGNGYYSPGFPSIKDALNPPKGEPTEIPYSRGGGWWTNIINYVKALGYENVSHDGNQIVIEVSTTKSLVIRKDGTFAQRGEGFDDYTDFGKWTFSGGKIIINYKGKLYDLKTIQTPSTAKPQQQPNSLTDVSKGGYLRFGMKGNVVRDMQVLINSLNVPEIKIDTNGVFNQQTLDAVIKVQKMLGVKPKNGKYGIFGPITMAAINKNKAGANDKTKIDPKTGLPYDTVGAMRDKLPDADTTTNSGTPSPKFSTDASRFSKYGVSKAQQDADLQKLGIQEGLIKKIVSKHLHSKL